MKKNKTFLLISILISLIFRLTGQSYFSLQKNIVPCFYYTGNTGSSQTSTPAPPPATQEPNYSWKTEEEKRKKEQEEAAKKKAEEEEAARIKAEEEEAARLAEEKAREEEYERIREEARKSALIAEEAMEKERKKYAKYKSVADAAKQRFLDKHNLNKEGLDLSGYKEIFDKIYARASVQAYKLQVVSEKMEVAYNELAEVYKDYGYSGDPVRVATGDYEAEYIDFEAQDFLEKFCVKRNYGLKFKSGSFGKNWACSLDARIIVCNFESWEEDIEAANEIITLSAENLVGLKNYKSFYNFTYPVEDLDELIQTATDLGKEFTGYLPLINKLAEEQRAVAGKNRYVLYGQYENPDLSYGTRNQLIYVDKEGISFFFEKEGNGVWKSVGELCQNMKIYDRNDGGYTLSIGDGTSLDFTEFGVLEKETDSNGNVIRYWNSNGRINKIQLKTGEIINVHRNSSGEITRLEGNVSGNTFYSYNNKLLTGVTDNKGISYSYKYNMNDYLSGVTKGDGSWSEIKYEYVPLMCQQVCSSIENSNGTVEKFSWGPEEKTMHHQTVDGDEEVYIYNDDRVPVYVKDYAGNITEFKTDTRGLIVSVTENGVTRKITYDQNYHPARIEYENGGITSINYNSLGLITSYVDPDGFSTVMDYDSKGNITSVYYCGNPIVSCTYYSNGLVKKEIKGSVTTEYEYNNCGSITRVKRTYSDGQETLQTFEYDGLNRMIKSVDESDCETLYTYDENQVTEIFNNRKKIQHFYDSRKREYKTLVTDLKTGICHSKQVYFDWYGNVIKILLDDEIYEENSCTSNGKLREKTVWNLIKDNSVLEKQGIKSEYVYGNLEVLNKTHWSIVDYNQQDYVRYVSQDRIRALQTVSNITVDESESQEYKNLVWTKGNRIKNKVDKELNNFTYYYKTDGSYYVTCLTPKGLSCDYTFDFKGKLLKKTDLFGQKFSYSYNENNQLIKETGPDYEKLWEYDCFNRNVRYSIKDKDNCLIYDKTFVYDDKAGIVYIYQNGDCSEILTMDAWNRPVEIINKNGKRLREYDVLNQPVSETDACGNITRVEYDVFGNPGYIQYADGSEEFLVHDFSGDLLKCYDGKRTVFEKTKAADEKIVVETDAFGNQTKQSFDRENYLLSSENFVSGKTVYQWNHDHSQVTVTGANGSQSVYKYDTDGKLIYEKNASGNVCQYTYDLKGRLLSRCNFDGTVDNYSYDDKCNKTEIIYSTGEKTEIIRNCMGLISDAVSADCSYHFEYDLSGNLLSVEDDFTRLRVDYTYDSFGRCIRKESSPFCLEYSYDECGRISKILDAVSGTFVSFSYDKKNREIERFVSNGTKTSTWYNQQGKIFARVTENSFNQIIAADFVLYDENGRITMQCNQDGLWTRYSYDEKGRLSKSVYPYSKELENFYLDEAWNCGVYLKDEETKSKYISLSSAEMDGLNEILKTTSADYKVSVVLSMRAWEEDYTYTETGSVAAVHNCLGTILYDYDMENRLVAKYSSNSLDSGMHFEWNENGNLVRMENRLYKMDFVYGGMNRPLCITEVDSGAEQSKTVSFNYDPFGRRVRETLENVEGENSICYFYDGFSLNVMHCAPLMKNNTAATNYYGGKNDFAHNDIRWLDDSDYQANGSFRFVDSQQYESYGNDVKSNSLRVYENLTSPFIDSYGIKGPRENRAYTTVNVNGQPVMNIFIDNGSAGGRVIEYFLSDCRNHSVGTMDEDSRLQSQNTYDAWGNIISGEKNYVYSNSHSMMDSKMTVYNLGYRDYLPVMKSFTSRDPVRDGSNWFAFCNGDPVNFQDSNGLTVGPTDLYDLMTNYEDDILIGNSTYEKLNENGCYITTFVNMLNTLKERYGVEINEEYDTVEKINDHKDMFCTDEKRAGMFKDKVKTMETLFGNDFGDYYTENLSTTPVLKAVLAKINAVPEEYLVAAVFDLSEVSEKATNHMVALNEIFNEDGYIDSEDSVTASSLFDLNRLTDDNDIKAYNINNLKEIRFVKTGKTACN